METDQGVALPLADAEFYEIFMPYEIRLTQRRAMTWGSTPDDQLPPLFTGLYLVQPVYAGTTAYPRAEEGGAELRRHVETLVRQGLRDSDVLGYLGNDELLAVVRDLDPHQSYVVAQRLLSACNRSDLLLAAGIGMRIGYLVYPLTSQPNYPPDQWIRLVQLAALVGGRAPNSKGGTGFGLMRGPATATTNLPETDLVDLAFEDLDSLVSAGLLTLQRLHLFGNS